MGPNESQWLPMTQNGSQWLHDGYQSVRMGPVELLWNLRLTLGINGSGLVMLDHNGSFGLFWVLLDLVGS